MTGLREYWDKRRADNAKVKQDGSVRMTINNNRVQVVAPMSPAFIKGAKELSGRWRHRTGQWTFPIASMRLVRALVLEVYGKNALDKKEEEAKDAAKADLSTIPQKRHGS